MPRKNSVSFSFRNLSGERAGCLVKMDDGDFWDDDGIDDAMLVAASQMVEGGDDDDGRKDKKDSLDEATLSMLIREVEHDDDFDDK